MFIFITSHFEIFGPLFLMIAAALYVLISDRPMGANKRRRSLVGATNYRPRY